jgi:tetratricopeptide (TPR) repeat protein
VTEIFKPYLERLVGADFWITGAFLILGVILWTWLGITTKRAKSVLSRQIVASVAVAFLAGCAIWVDHAYFQREPLFSNNVTGVLVMRIVGDDVSNSLQGDLVESLNGQLKNEGSPSVEIHPGRETIDSDRGLSSAHKHARAIGERLNAKLVIWGRKGTERRFYPRITVVSPPENWGVESERTLQTIDEVRLPEELVNEPFFLIHFASGYSYFIEGKLKEAKQQFAAALRRSVGSPKELADLQFFTATCASGLSRGQKDAAKQLQEAIDLLEKAATVYQGIDPQKWAAALTNIGDAYSWLDVGDRTANLQKAISAFEEALGVYQEKFFPTRWASLQNNLCNAYSELPTDRAGNLQKAISACERPLQVTTNDKDDLAIVQAMAENNLGKAYFLLPTGDRAANLEIAITAYEKALVVFHERNFRGASARVENNLGNAYLELPNGDRASNLRKAISAYETALRVRTENDFPVDWGDYRKQRWLCMVSIARRRSRCESEKGDQGV